MPSRKHDDKIAMKRCRRARCHDQAAISRAGEGGDGAFDLVGIAQIDRLTSTRSDCAAFWMAPNRTVPEGTSGSRRTAARVMPGAIGLRSSSHFPLKLARPGQGIDETCADWIDSGHEHDRQSAVDMLQCRQARAATGQDDVRRERGQFCCVSARAVDIVLAPAGVDRTLRPLLQPVVLGLAGTP